ncbi:hypothetical protein ACN2XU_22835 [Primorskyibacter sp. 2E107]|uniref:hypothetical protein n=1 Tax=Primorskyibacter sp. 2E107 TaxID=3403458 RepID=UPI003AF648CB
MSLSSKTKPANPLDKFYTRPETAQSCLQHLWHVLPDLSADLFVEPSAGDGTFLDLLPEPRVGIDISPDAPGIIAADYLTWQPDQDARRIVFVGNPPFGKNASLAIRFFNRAAEYAEVIAMILPASLMKGSMQSRLDRRFHLVSEMPLHDELFRVGDHRHPVHTVFQVWQRRPTLRPKCVGQTKHQDFRFVAAASEADFAVRRIGGRAGAILPLPVGASTARGYSPNSNLFIKAVGSAPEIVEARFKRLDFSDCRRQVASNPSVSKREIVALYDAQLEIEALLSRQQATGRSMRCLDAVAESGT